MNKKELYRLIGGTAVLAMLILGSMLIINTMQASDFGELSYKVDIYADHYHGDPSWPSLQSMYYARNDHTTTLMADGRILAVGGNGYNNMSTAEIYNPTTNSWAITASPTYTRTNHTATLLNNGRILVAGGVNSLIAETFNPTTISWSPTNSMNAVRYSHTSTRLNDGRVLVAGGNLDKSAEIYDPTTNSWTSTGTMNEYHALHTATRLPDGRVLVAGGSNGTGIKSAEIYNPSNNSWTSVPDMHKGRHDHAATLLPNGRVLISSGEYNEYTAEIYNPTANNWTLTTNMKDYRMNHSSTLFADGRVLVAGGSPQVSVEIYDPATDTWAPTTKLTTHRLNQEAVKLADGRIIVLGGLDASAQRLNSVEVYGSKQTIISNAPIGKPGSYFTFWAFGLPPNEKINIFLNGQQIGVGISNNTGSLTFQVSTVGAQPGNYFITLVPTGQAARGQTTNASEETTLGFTVDANAVNTWPKEAGIPFYNTPADSALDNIYYFPLFFKE